MFTKTRNLLTLQVICAAIKFNYIVLNACAIRRYFSDMLAILAQMLEARGNQRCCQTTPKHIYAYVVWQNQKIKQHLHIYTIFTDQQKLHIKSRVFILDHWALHSFLTQSKSTLDWMDCDQLGSDANQLKRHFLHSLDEF